MKNPTKTDLDKAIKLRLDGKNWTEVLEATGLSHSQAERHEFRFKMFLGLDGFEPIPVPADASLAQIGQTVAQYRAQGVSWGVIGERMNLTESKVRRAFAESTGADSKGGRIGKGGRFAFQAPHLYEPTPEVGFVMVAGQTTIPEVTQAGTAKGLPKEVRETSSAVRASLLKEREDRKAKRLEEAKANRAKAAKANA